MEKPNSGFPNFVWNSPEWKHILIGVFKHDAPFYDLERYDQACPGTGKKLWDIIQNQYNKLKEARAKAGTLSGNSAITWR